MAFIQNTTKIPTLNGKIGGLFQGFFDFLVRLSESNIRVRELERFNAMSDAELAQRGMSRDDIVRHVFRGML